MLQVALQKKQLLKLVREVQKKNLNSLQKLTLVINLELSDCLQVKQVSDNYNITQKNKQIKQLKNNVH